jgi:hypothetical protein
MSQRTGQFGRFSKFMFLATAMLTLGACGGDESDPVAAGPTPAEIADEKQRQGTQYGSKADSDLDGICESNGWIGDGVCDSFCSLDIEDCGGVAETPPVDDVEIVDEEVEVPQEDVDQWAPARDVNTMKIKIEGDAPDSYKRANVDGFNLGGTEFWQKWAGGENPTFSFSKGSDNGRACMQASAIRFETIMTDPPAEIVALKENSNWSGRFFNWNDDYTGAAYDGSRGAVLWAWRTGLMKWISQTTGDGYCYIPTLDMLKRAAANCKETAETAAGEIQGCQAR